MQAALMFVRGRFVSVASGLKTLLPFAVVMSVGLIFGGRRFFAGWATVLLLVAFVLILGDAAKKLPVDMELEGEAGRSLPSLPNLQAPCQQGASSNSGLGTGPAWSRPQYSRQG
jgi:hypothetical protein